MKIKNSNAVPRPPCSHDKKPLGKLWGDRIWMVAYEYVLTDC